ncbi:MAG TPA: HD domain-containing phosphohydrolase [Candidatus Baltobacteraceae bacterium]|nr:HD domain-containing phosphohydrolase [Candidatus Baltobacteraceae bacterium]
MKPLVGAAAMSLADCIQNNRRSIVLSALMRALPPERRTVLAHALANRTIDQLVEAVVEGRDDTLLAWIRESLRGFGRDQALFDLFASTVSSALDVASSQMGPLPANAEFLEDVHRRIDLCTGAFRIEVHRQGFALEAVDAKIDEVLYRLSEWDTTTAEHSRCVGMWCWRVAKRMGVPRDEALLAARSGLIHDVGKIFTPLEILTAPRKLTEDEWDVMRQHAMQGVNLISDIRELERLVPAVRWHHERMDGRGYPDALDPVSIPFIARIVSVADAFNAMVARRPYRTPLAPSAAIEELKRHRGAQFDPAIVEAMIDVVLQDPN